MSGPYQETGGLLAAALAKAQGSFAPVKRDKTVTVKTKTGGSYSFSYAPLDTILEAVRQPLADNGLVVVQLLDDDDLVTSLLHESGAVLSGRVSLPRTDDIQGFGSAITYLRRYAIQALLGIAAEDDDDGNRAAGNVAQPITTAPPITTTDDGGLIGTVEKGKSPVDLNLRQTPDGPAWGFKLKSGSKGYQALATGALAEALSVSGLAVGTRVIVYGRIDMVPWDKDGKAMPPYARIAIERVTTPDFTLPAETTEAESLPLPLDDDERVLVGGGLPA